MVCRSIRRRRVSRSVAGTIRVCSVQRLRLVSSRRTAECRDLPTQRDCKPARCALSTAENHIESLVSTAPVREYFIADRADTRIPVNISVVFADT